MADSTAGPATPFVRALACAALHPGLGSVLVFDSPPTGLEVVADLLAKMVKTTTGQEEVPRVTLGATQSEDDLWGLYTLATGPAGIGVTWQSSLLLPEPGDNRIGLVVIPDLTRVSLAVARACVTRIGDDYLELERHGRHTRRPARFLWLAAAPRDHVGEIAPHLLDRFALRLDGRLMAAPDRLRALLLELAQKPGQAAAREPELDPNLIEALRSPRWPELSAEVVPAVLEAQEQGAAPPYPVHGGSRRAVALSRLAVALARLEGAAQVTRAHVEEGASLLGLKTAKKSEEQAPDQPEATPKPPPPIPKLPSDERPTLAPESNGTQLEESEPVLDPGPARTFPVPVLPLDPADPYPEDRAPIQREAASLRLGPRRHRSETDSRGTVVGVRRARDPRDLAWVPSLLEAKKFEAARRRNNPRLDPDRLPLQGSDLRSYRRMPVPEQMLVLVMDYTSLGRRNWRQALLPHLQWAYVERANVGLVRIGAATAVQVLQADRILVRNLLVPQLDAALRDNPGSATPLAHGLDLALHTLRHALQHGRGGTDRARLVVLSDGRGNVPLEASRRNRVEPPVERRGIEDALAAAHQLARLDRVERFFLDPEPQEYPRLPEELAEALGSTRWVIPSFGEEQ